MKKILFLINILILSVPICAQSAYKTIKIESLQDYEYRQSQRGQEEKTYSSYTGEKQYISCSFFNKTNNICYKLTPQGRIIDYRNEISGNYFVGEEIYYKCHKVYIRWEHGGETIGRLNYGERTDGKPILGIKGYSGAYSIYNP